MAPWKNGRSRPALKSQVTTRTQFLGGHCVNWNCWPCCVVKLAECERANRAVAAFALRPWAKCTTTRSTIEAWQHAAAEHVALDGSQL